MFEEQLELFKKPEKERLSPEEELEGKFSPAFLSSIRLFLEEKLQIDKSDRGKSGLPELLTEFRKRGETFGAFDQVLVLAHYREIAGVSDDKAAQRKAHKEVAYEIARLARELGLPIFSAAYPKIKEALPESLPAKEDEAEPGGGMRENNLKLFGRGNTFVGRSHNEEDERK